MDDHFGTNEQGIVDVASARRVDDVLDVRLKLDAVTEYKSVIELYNRLLKARGTNAVVSLSESGQCAGCHVKVTPATLIKVNADKEIVQCENCGRILFAG